jgi:eukaryotic-like serine/threonine-protein kinase
VSESADQTEAMASAQIADEIADGGLVLGGRYELTERIANGGMASVWRAYDDVLARTVAVKLLHDHLAADSDFRERFRREAIAAAKLTHPNVVSLYDTGSDEARVYLVMEFVDGATLREVIADLGSMEPGQAAAIGEKVARALDYAHERGLVHRDVKPANILIGDDGAVKVADFGIAKAEEHDGDLTKTGMVLGTAAYVAPEQITGDTAVDGRADQYALGCMLYEALTGRQPFKGDTAVATAAQRLESSPTPLRSLRADIPRGLDSIVMRAMARDPADRFVSLGAMADALAAFADIDMSHTAALPLATAHRATNSGSTPARPEQRVAVAPPEPEPRETFLRTEGRWLLPVIALIMVAGALIAVGVSSGIFDPSALPGVGNDTADEGDAGDAGDEPEPVNITAATAFDPFGDNSENDSQLPSLLDGDDGTAWRSETYNTADFGGLKDGVGFYVTLEGTQTVSAVALDIVSAGLNAQISVSTGEPPADPGAWDAVGEITNGEGRETVELDEPAEADHVLVWITAPLPATGGNRAELAGITVLGPAEDAR